VLTEDRERNMFIPEVAIRHHGVENNYRLNRDLFKSGEYQRLKEYGDIVNDLIQDGATVVRGEKSEPISSFEQAYDWLIQAGRKGQTISRYKGLGEMNPDQLWETTMDPDNRRMMQVTIEDAIAADQLFTTLMGDEVEPRRDFIESNAMSVENLDV
jgi:DNA gyrase subunit B